jgi:hypothetical protein
MKISKYILIGAVGMAFATTVLVGCGNDKEQVNKQQSQTNLLRASLSPREQECTTAESVREGFVRATDLASSKTVLRVMQSEGLADYGRCVFGASITIVLRDSSEAYFLVVDMYDAVQPKIIFVRRFWYSTHRSFWLQDNYHFIDSDHPDFGKFYTN